MKMKFFVLLPVALLWIFLCSHEYLLIAEQYIVKRGDQLYVHLFVSQGFNVELERTLEKSITRNFMMITNTGTTDLLTTTPDKQLPVIEKTVDFDGLAMIAMERDYSRIELEPAKFAEYLVDDHLDNISFDASKANLPQREKYSRYLKALLLSGNDAGGDLYKKELGYHLEIILQNNPYLLKEGEEVRAKIVFMGKPLTNKTVTIRNREADDNAISFLTKTNVDGIFSFKITKGGTWAVHLTHMIPCSDKKDCDWESFWASYTFGIR